MRFLILAVWAIQVDASCTQVVGSGTNPCVCKDEWASPGYSNCGETQNGCAYGPTCDGDPMPWCKISNPGCDEEESSGGWMYCEPKYPNILGSGSNPCICKDEWDSPGYSNCGEIQNGCESPTCDGDPLPWCKISNPGCDEEESSGGWMYCNPRHMVNQALGSGPNPCVCKDVWASPGYSNCGVPQEGCAYGPTCDGDPMPWCKISNPGCDEEESSGGWMYCTPEYPNVLGSGSNPCICKDEWDSPGYSNCGEIQNGCESPTCDGDPLPWCKISNPGCDEEESSGGWMYCSPNHNYCEGTGPAPPSPPDAPPSPPDLPYEMYYNFQWSYAGSSDVQYTAAVPFLFVGSNCWFCGDRQSFDIVTDLVPTPHRDYFEPGVKTNYLYQHGVEAYCDVNKWIPDMKESPRGKAMLLLDNILQNCADFGRLQALFDSIKSLDVQLVIVAPNGRQEEVKDNTFAPPFDRISFSGFTLDIPMLYTLATKPPNPDNAQLLVDAGVVPIRRAADFNRDAHFADLVATAITDPLTQAFSIVISLFSVIGIVWVLWMAFKTIKTKKYFPLVFIFISFTALLCSGILLNGPCYAMGYQCLGSIGARFVTDFVLPVAVMNCSFISVASFLPVLMPRTLSGKQRIVNLLVCLAGLAYSVGVLVPMLQRYLLPDYLIDRYNQTAETPPLTSADGRAYPLEISVGLEEMKLKAWQTIGFYEPVFFAQIGFVSVYTAIFLAVMIRLCLVLRQNATKAFIKITRKLAIGFLIVCAGYGVQLAAYVGTTYFSNARWSAWAKLEYEYGHEIDGLMEEGLPNPYERYAEPGSHDWLNYVLCEKCRTFGALVCVMAHVFILSSSSSSSSS